MTAKNDDTNGKAKENAAVLVICFFVIIGIILARNHIDAYMAYAGTGITGFITGFKIGLSL